MSLITTALALLLGVGPERPLTHAPIDLAPGPHNTARVAVSDDGAFAIWTDFRRDRDLYRPAVYGTRLDRDGNVLDPTGVLISPNARAGEVLWTGRAYLVAYREHPWVVVRSLTPEGVLGTPVRVVNTDWINAESIRMATNGRDVVLVTNAGLGAVLSLEGEFIRPIAFDRPDRHHLFSVDVAAAGSTYAIVSVTSPGIQFRQLDGAPVVLSGSAGATTVSIASDGTQFLVVWDVVNLVAQPVRVDGQAAGPQQPLTEDVAPLNPNEPAAHSPTLVWRGSDYLLTFAFTAQQRTATLALRPDGGIRMLPSRFSTFQRASEPDAGARSDGSGAMVWVTPDSVVRGMTFQPPRTNPIAFSAAMQKDVRVAAHGSSFVSAWVEKIGPRTELRLSRGLGGRPVTVADGDMQLIDILVDGNVVWVVWTTGYYRIYARRYSSSLQPLDPEPLTAPEIRGENVSAAAGGGSLLVAWVASGNGLETDIHAAVFRPAGESVDITQMTFDAPFNDTLPAAAWNGSEFVVTWAHATEGVWWQFPTPVDEHVVAARVGADGVVRDPVALAVSDEPGVTIGNLKAASANGAVGLVWQTHARKAPYEQRTLAARFDGAERPPRRVLDNPANAKVVSLAQHGEGFLMLRDALELFLLSAMMEVQESTAIPGGTSDADVVSAAGMPVAAYSRVADEPQYGGVTRIFVRTGAPGKRRVIR